MNPLFIPIEGHPTEVTLLAGFKAKWVKKEHRYSLELNPTDSLHRQQFKHLFPNSIALGRLNGHLKDLAAFDPRLNEKPISQLLEEIIQACGQLPVFKEVYQTRQAEAVIIQEVIKDSTDVEQVVKVHAELRKKRDEAELAKLKGETLERKIESLKARVVIEMRAKDEATFKELIKQVHPEISVFNQSVMDAYRRLGKLFPLFAEMAELKPGGFPAEGFTYLNPFINPQTGKLLKTFRGVPQILEQGQSFYLNVETLKK